MQQLYIQKVDAPNQSSVSESGLILIIWSSDMIYVKPAALCKNNGIAYTHYCYLMIHKVHINSY